MVFAMADDSQPWILNALTQAQRQAIRARGNVLVVAGAGTGKTSTLVHRCVSLLLEENCSLDEILMVTFTEAAAAQMRSRIRAELLRLQISFPQNSAVMDQIHKQVALLDSAHICTLHSFCLQLVRAHFYQLGIDPAISVLDERQSAPLVSQTMDALFARYYEDQSLDAIAVRELVREWGRGAEQRIRDRIVRLHRYTQALDDPEMWLAKQEAIYQQQTPVAWRQWFASGFAQWRTEWVSELQSSATVPPVGSFLQVLAAVPPRPSLRQGREALGLLREATLNVKRWPTGVKTKAIKTFLTEVEFLASVVAPDATATGTNEPLVEDWQWVRPYMSTLLRLTREFTNDFSKAKRDLGGVDFSDLEQFAIRLLREPAIARQWQERLRFIFVDECQDINRAQDAILTALSREETHPNRFLVGDVKQSIYRFRLSNPKILCEYEERWRKQDSGGKRISLADNFRSREALLDFVNRLFAALMHPEVGGVGYAQDVHLRFGSPMERQHLSLSGVGSHSGFGAGPDLEPLLAGILPRPGEPNVATSFLFPKGNSENQRVELHLVTQTHTEVDPDHSEEQSTEDINLLDLTSVEREARLVAKRLLELREQRHLVWDEGVEQFRPAEWRDMVVLMRSPSNKAEAFAKEFSQLGIPLVAMRGGFFESLEVCDLLNMLKLIDNPLQDLPLLAILRSPLAAISLDQLADIRAHSREKPFWSALQKFHHEGRSQKPDLQSLKITAWSKVDLFLRQFEGWRELARQSSLSYCLETILAETHYDALLLAQTRGDERVANVRRLLDLARDYDPYKRQGLYRFLQFVQAQQEAEVELEPASAQSENAVRLMSIHKSKGLEFPVVVLAGLGGQFNFQDLRQDILLHETYGLCPRIKPPNADQTYPSLPYWLARRDEQRELLGEEMRLLYVALTRARDTLILTATCKGLQWSRSEAAPLLESSEAGLTPTELREQSESCSSFSIGQSVEDEHEDQNETHRGINSTGKRAIAASLTPRQIGSARSFLDWFLIWLPQVTTSADWSNDREGQTSLLRWRTYDTNDLQLMSVSSPSNYRPDSVTLTGEELDDHMGLLKLQERVLWQYPFSTATTEPAVKGVSSLISEQGEVVDDAQLLFVYEPSTARRRSGHWKGSSGQMAAADIGSAHHRLLETAALDRVSSLEDLKVEAAQMLNEGALTKEEVAALDFKSLLAFWKSEIGQRILAEASDVHREIPFTARFSPEDFASLNLCPNAAELGGEYFVVRGKADLAVLLPREIWLLDFKTDQIRESEAGERIRHYAPQLKLYALGLSRIYRRPVTHRWLHFFALDKSVSV